MGLEEVASEFIEVAMARDRFLSVPPSVIAYAAMLSAMELTSKHRLHQQQQCYYDWSTFLRNMTEVAEMGDIFSDACDVTLGCSATKPGRISRAVCRTKMLMDRIVNDLNLPPEEDDAAFFNVDLMERARSSENARDDNDKNVNKNHTLRYLAQFAKSFAAKSSSPPSPTSTVSSVNTRSSQ